jgi:hypothetical protein
MTDGVILTALKVNKSVECLFGRFVREKNLPLKFSNIILGVHNSYDPVIGYIWYCCSISFHVC